MFLQLCGLRHHFASIYFRRRERLPMPLLLRRGGAFLAEEGGVEVRDGPLVALRHGGGGALALAMGGVRRLARERFALCRPSACCCCMIVIDLSYCDLYHTESNIL